MAAAYVTEAEIQAQITAAKLAALFDDDSGGTFLVQLIEDASERVRAAALRAYGSDVLGASTTANRQARAATMAVFLLMAYGRREQTVPERFFPDLALVDKLEAGVLALVGVAADAKGAIGGADFSEGDEDVSDDARTNPFRRDRMGTY